MIQRLRITFRGMQSSPSIEDKIREYADRLNDLFDGIVGCHVVIDQQSQKHRHGNPFRARVDLHVPGKQIIAESERAEPKNAAGAYEALHEAFDRAERQLLTHRDHLRSHRA